MSRERDKTLGMSTMRTDEGLAVYPLGAWGAGYLVDAKTERRLAAWAGRSPWWDRIICPAIAVAVLSWAIPHHPFFAGLACGLLYAAIYYAIDLYLLRHCRRTPDRLKADETRVDDPARVGHVSLASGLVSVGAIAVLTIVIAIISRTLDAWLFAASFALAFGWVAFDGHRRLRIQAGRPP